MYDCGQFLLKGKATANFSRLPAVNYVNFFSGNRTNTRISLFN